MSTPPTDSAPLPPLPSNAVRDQLGKRLVGGPDEAARRELRPLLLKYQLAVELVAEEVRRAGYESTSRIKQIGSIVDKIRDQGIKLSAIRDLAGLRVVCDVTQQQAAARRIAEVTGARIVRELADDRNGYRAIHLEARLEGGYRVEIQVRSELQDQWASLMEDLGRTMGAQGKAFRYGAPAEGPLAEIAEVIRGALVRYSEAIAGSEDNARNLHALGRRQQHMNGLVRKYPKVLLKRPLITMEFATTTVRIALLRRRFARRTMRFHGEQVELLRSMIDKLRVLLET